MNEIRNARDPVDEAVEWHLRLDCGTAREEDWLAFEQWLSSDDRHRDAYDRVERTNAELGEAKLHEASIAAERARGSVVIDFASRRSHKAQPSRRTPRAVAASVAFFTIAVSIAYLAWPRWVTYATAKGETRNIELADGTRIRLNSGSRIRVALGKERQVVMDDAEASFDVAKDPSRPFVVTVGDRQVRVVGTDFNILHHAGQMTVTLRRGTIDVVADGALVSTPPIRLAPGEQLVHRAGKPDRAVRKVEPDIAYAWQDGHLIYHNRPLSDVVSDLNRYFTVPILAGGDTAALSFSGVLAIDTEDAVVQRLETFLPLVARRTDGKITLHLKPEN